MLFGIWSLWKRRTEAFERLLEEDAWLAEEEEELFWAPFGLFSYLLKVLMISLTAFRCSLGFSAAAFLDLGEPVAFNSPGWP